MTDIIGKMIKAGACALCKEDGKDPQDSCDITCPVSGITYDIHIPLYTEYYKKAETCLRAAFKQLPDMCFHRNIYEGEIESGKVEIYNELKEWAQK